MLWRKGATEDKTLGKEVLVFHMEVRTSSAFALIFDDDIMRCSPHKAAGKRQMACWRRVGWLKREVSGTESFGQNIFTGLL